VIKKPRERGSHSLRWAAQPEGKAMLTNKKFYAVVKKPTTSGTIGLHGLCWFGDRQRIEGNRIVLVWGCTESGR
jgi:hypothetical protein